MFPASFTHAPSGVDSGSRTSKITGTSVVEETDMTTVSVPPSSRVSVCWTGRKSPESEWTTILCSPAGRPLTVISPLVRVPTWIPDIETSASNSGRSFEVFTTRTVIDPSVWLARRSTHVATVSLIVVRSGSVSRSLYCVLNSSPIASRVANASQHPSASKRS